MVVRRTIWAKVAIVAATLALALSLVACGPAEKTQTSTDSSSSTASSSAEEVASSAKAAAEEPEPVTIEVNDTIVDEEIGYTIDFKQAIVDLPFDNANIWANGYRTGVAVEVELTNNSEYVTTLYGSDLCLLVNGEKVNAIGNGVSNFQTYADENGLVPLSINGAGQGESISGWIFYYFDTGSGNNELALRYARDETRVDVIGGAAGGTNYTIPAEDFDIDFYPPAA